LSRAALMTKYSGSKTDLTNGYQKLTLQITPDQPAYQWQTITIENRTLKLRWSVDVEHNSGGKQLGGIIAGPNDDLYVIVNRTTYAVVSLFGFGVGVYDVNAIESNDHPIDSDYKPAAEIVALTNGNSDEAIDPLSVHQCNQADLASSGLPCAINDLTYTPEALMRTGGGEGTSSIQLLALEQRHGIFDGIVTPPTAAADDKILPGRIDANSVGLSLTSPYLSPGGGWDSLDQPRLRTLRNMYKAIGGVDAKDIRPVGRHTGIAYYARPPAAGSRTAVSDEYALVASFQYGVIVVKLNEMLGWNSVVDVIWIPAGAMSVRVMPRGDMAVVVDGAGRVLLVDLRRIDESSKVRQPLPECRSADCTDELFPSAAASLKKRAQLPPDADWTEVGVDDPRIIWKSDPHLVHGTLAPLVDPDTGIVFTGDIDATAQAEINTIAATDPRVRFMVNIGDQSGYRETGALVPLGIAPPTTVMLTGPDASLAAFRLELWLPGSIADSLASSNGELRMALESERVLGVATEQTVAPLASAHLRRATIEGNADPRAANFKLSRLVPYDPTDVEMKSIRYQEGYNHFASPWVVTMTDPRAAKDYSWTASPATKMQLDCASCDRPQFLQNANLGTDYFELWSLGNFISARPEANVFTGTKYAYLGTRNRVRGRVSTIRADLVRPSDGATPLDNLVAKNLPTAGTTSEGVIALNTGEVVAGATDLAIKGRGIDFVLTRYYSSAIAHVGPFGRNIDSPLFARVRALPNGDVEFYDGTGRRDLFVGGKTPPLGVFLRMTGSTEKIIIAYPDNTRLYFDALGRLIKMTDRNHRNLTKTDGSDGNRMDFFYGVNGKLAFITDPTNRTIRFDYYPSTGSGAFEGCVSSVTDFDNRVVHYTYDTNGRLTKVSGPDPESLNSATPSTTYNWGSSASTGTKQQIYASGQLSNEIDGLNRTVWTASYFSAMPWAAQTLASGGGMWTITPTDNFTTVLDPNNHSWEYGRDASRRIHYLKEPGGATTTYDYDDDGRLTSVTRPLGDKTTYSYAPPADDDRRSMLNVETATEYPRTGSDEAAANQTRITRVGYGPANLPTSITTPDGANTAINRDERGNPQFTTDAVGVTTTTHYDEHGLLRTSSDPRTGDATYDYVPTGVQKDYLFIGTTSDGTTTYGVDNRGNVETIKTPEGTNTILSVNKLDQIEKQVNGVSSTTMTYDAAQNLATRSALTGTTPAGTPGVPPVFVPGDMRVGVDDEESDSSSDSGYPVAEAVVAVGNAGGGWGAFSKACGKTRFSAAFHRPAASIAWWSFANCFGVLYPRELCGRRSL
jgi:YD repeat-containing protein